MNKQETFHIITLGWEYNLIEKLLKRVEAKNKIRFSHIVHPKYIKDEWPNYSNRSDIYYFRDELKQCMPKYDLQLLASLEQDGVPTVHNMIMSDRIVSKIRYCDALDYATFLTHKMFEMFSKIKPSIILGAYDGIHGSLALAVAKQMNIPWFALHFTIIPPGLTGFCDHMSPAARVPLNSQPSRKFKSMVEEALQKFESNKIQASAYIAPPPLSLADKIVNLPKRLLPFYRTVCKSRLRKYLKYTEEQRSLSILHVLRYFYDTTMARRALTKINTLSEPPTNPYVFFGFQMQPESSIDVWAPFYSNQMWVIELLSRAIPPTHKLLVKIHKSDISNYSSEQLNRIQALPGVKIVAPFSNTRDFIQNADLIVAIQGTIGLEAALLGKAVIMLGDSPVTIFPNASRIGEITDLPILVRKKLAERPPNRVEIVNAYTVFLKPFLIAGHNNDWAIPITDDEIDGYVDLFLALEQYVGKKLKNDKTHNLLDIA